MTPEELPTQVAIQLKANTPLKEIRQWAIAKGFTQEQINAAFDKAHLIVQEDANRDPVLRLILGPALLVIAGFIFYTDYAGRSVGIGTILGVVLLLIGGRLVFSLIKQWRSFKRKPQNK